MRWRWTYRFERYRDAFAGSGMDRRGSGSGPLRIWQARRNSQNADMDDDAVATCLERLRTICLGFPEVSERLSHGSPTFFVREKKTLITFHDDHHGDGRVAVWAPAPAGVQEEMAAQDPDRFFRPAYVGHLGWVGYRLDRAPDWDEVGAIVEDAYRKVAPKTLVRLLDEG